MSFTTKMMVFQLYTRNGKLKLFCIHMCREKSAEEQSFSFRWELRMSFDAEVQDLLEVALRIVELRFGTQDGKLCACVS